MTDLADLLFAVPGAVAASPDDPCVHWRGRTVGRGEVAAAAQRLADTLRGMGVSPDSAVAALVPTTPLGIVVRFGIWRAGAAVAALDAAAEPAAFAALVEVVRPAAVVRPSLDEASLPAGNPKLLAIASNGYEERIYVRGDRNVNYGTVMKVMGAISAAGFRRIALVTELEDAS